MWYRVVDNYLGWNGTRKGEVKASVMQLILKSKVLKDVSPETMIYFTLRDGRWQIGDNTNELRLTATHLAQLSSSLSRISDGSMFVYYFFFRHSLSLALRRRSGCKGPFKVFILQALKISGVT